MKIISIIRIPKKMLPLHFPKAAVKLSFRFFQSFVAIWFRPVAGLQRSLHFPSGFRDNAKIPHREFCVKQTPMSEVNEILAKLDLGKAHLARELMPFVYDELRKLAASQLAKESFANSLNPTALVHEAYLRLVKTADHSKWENRGHFFAAAATAMRRILIERARKRKRKIHGSSFRRLNKDTELLPVSQKEDDLLALDEALVELANRDPIKACLVELRYFGGLTGDQAAEILCISPSTADRYWAFAKAWLRRQIDGGNK